MKGFKPKKSLIKRIKITAKGKLLRRHTKQNHFNAKERSKETRIKRGEIKISKQDKKIIENLLPI